MGGGEGGKEMGHRHTSPPPQHPLLTWVESFGGDERAKRFILFNFLPVYLVKILVTAKVAEWVTPST